MEEVHVLKNACPLCGGDIKGNSSVKFYCAQCNILFSKHNL